MPRVVVDLERLKVLHCGLGQLTLQLGREFLSEQRGDLRLDFLLPKNRRHLITSDSSRCIHTSAWRKESVFRWVRPWLAPMLPSGDIALWHSTQQLPKFLPWDERIPLILTINDLNFLREKPVATHAKRLRRIQRVVHRATVITTISHFVAGEIREHLDIGEKPLRVIYIGAPSERDVSATRPDFLPKGKFLFSLGQMLPKKNFHVLIDLVRRLPEYQLVIGGDANTEYGRFLRREIAARDMENRVVLPGSITTEDRNWLYKNCEAFVFPSLTEGFGLPVIEAMSFGRPVFMSDRTSLPEVGGNLGFYWRSFDPQHMVDVFRAGMDRAGADPRYSERTRQHASRFSWPNTAREYVGLYREVLQAKPLLRARAA